MSKQTQSKQHKKNLVKPRGGGMAQDGKIGTLKQYRDDRVVFFKDIVPPRIMTRLKFICNRKLNNAGFGSASIQFNANGAYDFDPAVASNQVAGFDELATIWGRYRVFAVKVKCAFVNIDSNIPSIVNIGFDSEPYAANAKLLANFDGPNQATKLTASTGQTPVSMSMRRRAIDVTGDDQVNTSNTWSGTGTSNPVSLWYVSVAADCTSTGSTFTLGVVIRAEFEIEIEWYERYDVDSGLDMVQKQKVLDTIRNKLLLKQIAEMQTKK